MKYKIYTFFYLLTFVFTANSQNVNLNAPQVDGSVYTTIIKGDTAYIGGSFTRVYNSSNSSQFGCLYDVSTWSLQGNFPAPNAAVYASIPDGQGGWYLGGDFTTVGGVECSKIAYISATGIVSQVTPDVINGSVRSLLIYNGHLLIGGTFTQIGTLIRNRLASINLSTKTFTDWSPNLNGQVNAIANAGDSIIVGGAFTSIGTALRSNAAMISYNNGSTLPVLINFNSGVNAILVSGNSVYFGGSFTSINSVTRNRLAAIQLSNGTLSSWAPNANSSVNTLAIGGSNIYIGGGFTTINSVSRNRVASVNASNGNLNSWNPNANSTVNVLLSIGSKIFVGGFFTSISNTTVNRLIALDTVNGQVINSWLPNPNGSIFTICYSAQDNKLFAGGLFNAVGGLPRNRVAAFRLSDGQILPWDPNSNGLVLALEIFNDKVILGGSFTSVGGQIRNRLASVDANTGAIDSWDPNVNGSVNALLVNSSKLFVGGQYSAINNTSRSSLSCIDLSTNSLTSFNPNITGNSAIVYSIKANNNILAIGGSFTTASGQSRNNLALFDLSLGSLLSMNPNVNNTIYTVAIDQHNLYIGGTFNTIGNATRNFFGSIDLSTGNISNLNPSPNSAVFSINLFNDIMYMGGSFTNINSVSKNRGAAIDTKTGVLFAWDPKVNSTIRSLSPSIQSVILGGDFTNVSNASIRGSAVVQATFEFSISPLVPSTVCNSSLIPVNFTYNLPISGAGATFNLEMSDTNGSFVNPTILSTIISNGSGQFNISLPSSTPNGTYLLRVVCVTTSEITINTTQITTAQTPAAEFKIMSSSFCLNENTFEFNDMTVSSSTYQTSWNFGEGVNDISSIENPTKTYQSAGKYIITLTTTSNNGCSSTFTDSVIVFPSPLSTINASGNTNICPDQSVLLYTNSETGGAYQWLENNTPVSNQNDTSFLVSITGAYAVVIANEFGCVDTSAVIQVANAPGPDVTITTTGSQIQCKGDSFSIQVPFDSSTSYQWFRNNQLINQTGSSINVTENGLYRVVANKSGCINTSNPIQVGFINSPINAEISVVGSTAFCDGGNAILNAVSNSDTTLNYFWYYNGVNVNNNLSQTSIFAKKAGNYQLIMSRNDGTCRDTSNNVAITVWPLPQPTLNVSVGDTTLCAGETLTMSTQSGFAQYRWFGNNTQINQLSNSFSQIVNQAGSYRVEVTTSNGCSNVSNNINVNVSQKPIVSITNSGSTAFCNGGSVLLNATATNASNFQWNLNGTPISNANSNSYIATIAGNYSVTAFNIGCSETSSNIQVNVNPKPSTSAISGDKYVKTRERDEYSVVNTPGSIYTWEVENGKIQGNSKCNGNRVTIQWSSRPGTGIIYVTERNVNGCVGNTVMLAVNIGNVNESITLNRDSLSYNRNGGTNTFNVTSNANWTINTSETWVSTNPTNGTNNATVNVTVQPMSMVFANMRTAVIDVIAGAQIRSLMVRQHPGSITTGLTSADFKAMFQVYPNPSNGEVFINNTTNETMSVQVFDVQGKLVKEFESNPGVSMNDLSMFNNGVYMIKLSIGDKYEFVRLILAK